MAITFIGAGTFNGSTTDPTAALSSGATTGGVIGDKHIFCAAVKPFSLSYVSASNNLGASTSTPALIAGTEITSGSVANGNGVGSTRVVAYEADALSAGGSSQFLVDLSAAPSPAIGGSLRLRSGTTKFDLSGAALADTVETGTAVSATGAVTAGQFIPGDMVVIWVGLHDDVINHTSQSLSIPGCTLDTITWFSGSTTAGNDAKGYLGYAEVLSGTSTAGNATYAATSSVSGKSATAVSLVRVREGLNPVIAHSYSGTSINLSYATANATSYVVERSLSFTSPSWTQLYSGPNTTYTDTGRTAGTPYWYRVTASASGYTSVSVIAGAAVPPFTETFSAAEGAADRPWENWSAAIVSSTGDLGGRLDITGGAGVMKGTGSVSSGAFASLDPALSEQTDNGLRAKFTLANFVSAAAFRPSIRTSDNQQNSTSTFPYDGYSFRVERDPAAAGSIVKTVAGVTSDLTPSSVGVGSVVNPLVSGTAYWIRAEAVGTTIRYRIWADGGAEPVTWTEVEDTSITKGRVAVAFTTNSELSSTVTLDDVEWYVPSTVTTQEPASGSGSFTVTASGGARAGAAGTASLAVTAVGTALGPPFEGWGVPIRAW